MSDIEKRIRNCENGIIAICALLEDYIPPEAKEGLDNMVADFFEASETFDEFNKNHFDGSAFSRKDGL